MTFTEWINTQEDICSKLREQGYEEKNDIRKFFNDRIRCILNTRDIPLKICHLKEVTNEYFKLIGITRENVFFQNYSKKTMKKIIQKQKRKKKIEQKVKHIEKYRYI